MITKFEIPASPGLHCIRTRTSTGGLCFLSAAGGNGQIFVWGDTQGDDLSTENWVLVLAEGERVPPFTANKLLGTIDTPGGRLHVFDGFMARPRRPWERY
jgi:hypothetical protein